MEQIVDFTVSGGGFQDFRPGQSSSSSSTFQLVLMKSSSPNYKKCDVGSALRVGTECRLCFHTRSSCGLLGRRRRRLDPHRLRARAILEEVAVRPLAVVPAVGRALTAAQWLWGYGCGSLWLLRDKSGPGWCVLLLVYLLMQWLEQPMVQAVRGCLSVVEAFAIFSSSTCLLRRDVRTWKTGPSLSPSFLSAYYGVWVLPVEYSVLDFFGRSCAHPTWFDSGLPSGQKESYANIILF